VKGSRNLAKTSSTAAKIIDEEFAAYQAESNAIWAEARKPNFDWSTVPLTNVSSTTNTVAWCRCNGHTDLKDHRKEMAKAVLAQLDSILLAAGFTKDGKTIWRKGVGDAKLQDKPATEKPKSPNPQAHKTSIGSRVFSSLRRAVSSVISGSAANQTTTKPHWAKTILANLPNPANFVATSVYLEFQRDRAGTCFYINVGIRPGGLNFVHSDKLAGEAVGSLYNGYYMFRPVHFTPDLPSISKPDQFHYMRLKEDPRFMPFVIDLIENRMIACLIAWADPATLKPPMPSEMAQHELPHAR
jgi:hypothetical protein